MLNQLVSPFLGLKEDVVPSTYAAFEHEHALTIIWSFVHAIRVVSGVCRSGKRPPPHTSPSKEEDVEKYLPTAYTYEPPPSPAITYVHLTPDRGGASGLRTMPDPDLHASPPNRGVDPVGERGHVRHTGGARATDVPVGGRAVVRAHLRDGC